LKGLQSNKNKGIAQLHLAVVLFGMAGLFGKLLILPAMIIVLGRVFFASWVLGAFLIFKNRTFSFKTTDLKTFIWLAALGVLLAFHWFSFFYAIQLTTVALGLITFATFPIFTAILEPLMLREKFEWKFLALAIIAGFGVYLASGGDFSKVNVFEGVIWGILSGLSFSFLSIGNRKMTSHTTALNVAFIEDLVATLVLIPFIFILDFEMTPYKWLLVFLLGTFLTAGAHYLFIHSLMTIKTRTASIITSLEPVYGIILAVFILREIPDIKMIIGCTIIIGIGIFISLLNQKSTKDQPKV
jgi:drug/metabolite transporter (DMT)-like permease